MITLYELHWSHYCEKVRLALDYKGLPWRAVEVDAFSRRQMRNLGLQQRYAFPTIVDEANINAKSGQAKVLCDSSPILRYLEQNYPDSPCLFPGDSARQREIYHQLIEFDTELAIPARRLGYTQLILECPQHLVSLFLGENTRAYRWPILRQVVAHGLGMLLCKRFDIHGSESMGLYEALEVWLLQLARRLEGREFVVGDAFSAADLALAAQLRPLKVVPFFFEHPQLSGLFQRQAAIVARYGREALFPYETAIAEARRQRPPVRRHLRSVSGELPYTAFDWQTIAANDQQNIWTASLATYPWRYWVGLRRNKVRQQFASSTIR